MFFFWGGWSQNNTKATRRQNGPKGSKKGTQSAPKGDQTKQTNKQCSEKVGAKMPTGLSVLGPDRLVPDVCWKKEYLGAKIDAQTQHKSMQEQVPKKNMKILKHQSCLMWKNMKNQYKYWFSMIQRLTCANEKSINNSSKMIPKSTPKGINEL